MNLDLSKGRAQSVANYLMARGIPKERIQLVDGRGDTQPIATNTTREGQAQNRRVDISLLK